MNVIQIFNETFNFMCGWGAVPLAALNMETAM